MSVARGSESRWRQLRPKDSRLPNVGRRISLAGEGSRELAMEPYCVCVGGGVPDLGGGAQQFIET